MTQEAAVTKLCLFGLILFQGGRIRPSEDFLRLGKFILSAVIVYCSEFWDRPHWHSFSAVCCISI